MVTESQPVIEVADLTVSYRQGTGWQRVVDADPSLFEEPVVKRAMARVTPQL